MMKKGDLDIKLYSTLSGVKIVALNYITVKYSLH